MQLLLYYISFLNNLNRRYFQSHAFNFFSATNVKTSLYKTSLKSNLSPASPAYFRFTAEWHNFSPHRVWQTIWIIRLDVTQTQNVLQLEHAALYGYTIVAKCTFSNICNMFCHLHFTTVTIQFQINTLNRIWGDAT